jgi:hypothetical protein
MEILGMVARGGARTMKLTLDKNSLGSGPKGLEIAVEGFAGFENAQVYIEIYEGMLQVHVWDGSQEDPVSQTFIPAGLGEWEKQFMEQA